MPTKHARLSASSAFRWINCPGSVALSDQCPTPASSSYADEGTLAHAIGELKLRYVNDEISKRQLNAKMKPLLQSEYSCGEMEEATGYYADAVIEALEAAGEDAELVDPTYVGMIRQLCTSIVIRRG